MTSAIHELFFVHKICLSSIGISGFSEQSYTQFTIVINDTRVVLSGWPTLRQLHRNLRL